MEFPTATAAGHKILAAKPIRGDNVQVDGWIVLCSLADNTYHPYVVWWMRESDKTTYSGDYFETYEEALKRWEKRK